MKEKHNKDVRGSLDEQGIGILADLADLGVVLSRKTSFYGWGIVLGISVGVLFCVGGLVIIILGFTGSIEWILEVNSLTSKLVNASPGAFFALLGMLIVWRYRPMPHESLRISPTRNVEYKIVSPDQRSSLFLIRSVFDGVPIVRFQSLCKLHVLHHQSVTH